MKPTIRFLPALLLGTILLASPAWAQPPQNREAAAKRAFATILKVLKSPRCANCHPTDDRPRQGDRQRVHLLGVERGPDGKGGPVQQCATCHRDENNEFSQVPGAPHWQLAPRSMGWLGLSDREIGRRLVDRTKNGGRSIEELARHMREDPLVLWAWEPGADRRPPPVSLREFRAALRTWLAGGGPVQTSSTRGGEE